MPPLRRVAATQTRPDQTQRSNGVLAGLALTEGTADPQVHAALGLGWQVSEFWLVEAAASLSTAGSTQTGWPPPTLKDIGQLDGDAIRQIVVAEMVTEQKDLGSIRLPNPESLLAAPSSSTQTDKAPSSAPVAGDNFHVQTLMGLMGHDPQLAYAYLVGVDLGDTVLRAYKVGLSDPSLTRAELKKQLAERVTTLARRIRELKATLGDYVADSVAAGLEDWQRWAATDFALPAGPQGARTQDNADLRNLFYRQGSIWRTLLTGERAPVSYLALRDYLNAAVAIVDDYGRLAWSFATQPIAIGLVVSLALVILVVALASVSTNSGIVGTVITALSAIGITGTSLVAGLKRLLDEADAILWHAEVGAAVALATNVLPPDIDRPSSRKASTKDLPTGRR